MTVLVFDAETFLGLQVPRNYPAEPDFLQKAEPVGRCIGRLSRRQALLYIALVKAADVCQNPARQYSLAARQIAGKLEFKLEEVVRKKFGLEPDSYFSIGPGFEVFVPSETKKTETNPAMIICSDLA